MHQLTWAPFNGIYFACYEETRKFVITRELLPVGPAVNLSSGAIAGIIGMHNIQYYAIYYASIVFVTMHICYASRSFCVYISD